MKKITIAFLVLAFFLMLSFPAQARQRVTFSNELIVDMVKYDPSPVRPGFSVDIWFEVNNIAKEPLGKVKLNLVEEFPFTVVEGVETFSLAANEKKQVKYKVNVNSNAKDTDYNLFLQYFSEKANTGYSQAFLIHVSRTAGIEVGVTDVSIHPGMIPPGDEATVGIVLENNADYVMKDMTVELSLESAATPFAPIGTTSKKKIREILIGAKTAIEFNIIALPSAEAGVYKVPLVVKYYDELGHSFNKSELLGLTVGSEPEVYIEVKEKEIYSSRGTGDIVLNIINKGLTDIKLLKMTLGSSEYYDVLSSGTVYIGDIDSDDEETAEFRLTLKGVKEFSLPITLEYRDANNRPYTLNDEVPVKIYSKSAMGVGGTSNVWVAVVVIAIVIGGAWYYYRRRSRAKARA